MLQADEARTLLDSIDATSLPGLRDRALIGLMVYTFAFRKLYRFSQLSSLC